MIDTIAQHLANKPILGVVFAIALIGVVLCIPYFLKQKKLYGSPFEFAPKSRKVWTGIACVTTLGIGIYLTTPYVEPPSDEIAIILGNTQNSPAPSISGDLSEVISSTMLAHKGEDIDTIIDSIRFISAVKQPDVIDLGKTGVKLSTISHNTSNAKRDAKRNITAIEEKLNSLKPSDNGANYFEAIMEARSNVKPGSRIIVIGSGLSDSGDLNSSKTNLLTNEETRKNTIQRIQEKYGSDHLENYSVEFYGLGDTTAPQEALSNIQKDIVRDIYKESIRKLGGKVTINTRTQTGSSVATEYVVGTTDTGCGDIKLVFDDEDLKFIGDKAIFIDEASAIKALSSIGTIWNAQRDTIEHIQIDGYTAHYPGADTLSQERADTVKKSLVGLGIPTDKITATGKGYGPYKTDAQNRTVKVNISRDNKQCAN